MKIVLINGPARSGKDSLATAILRDAQEMGVTASIIKFAGNLKEMTHRAFNLPERHDSQEGVKDQPNGLLLGKTPRQVYIAVSEMLMKPLFGQGVFGRMLVEEIAVLETIAREDGDDPTDLYLVSDSGFLPEAQVVVDRFGVENVILVRLTRAGYDFTGDSRGYITLPGVRTLDMNLGLNLCDLTASVVKLRTVVEAV